MPTKECEICKYFKPDAESVRNGYCIKGQGHPTTIDTWCSGFEYKSPSISVDISRSEGNKHFKAFYPVDTSSDIIVSTSSASIVNVLGGTIQPSHQERFVGEVEKIKKSEVKKGLEVGAKVNLGIFQAHIKKSWEW